MAEEDITPFFPIANTLSKKRVCVQKTIVASSDSPPVLAVTKYCKLKQRGRAPVTITANGKADRNVWAFFEIPVSGSKVHL